MASEQREWSRVFESLDDSGFKVLPNDRYTISKEIGRGGAKIVYKAVDNNSGREVAYVQPLNNDESKRDLFMREARITAYLQHPHILPVYDVSDESDSYFVCKLLRGKTLSDIRPRQHSRNEKVSLFRKICEAVEYAHSRGVLHLDLKPDNIRLDKHGEVLVIDWGLAEIFCTEGAESPLDNPLISVNEISAADYTSLGTPGYMSPEQIEGDKVSCQTDLFSLGALLYFMFHMKAPFRGRNVEQVFKKTLAGKVEYKSDELTIGLKSIISKCLSINPEERYNNVGELIIDLDAIENDYVPEAENAGFLRHLQLLYKRNRLLSNLVILFITVFIILNSRYIKELNFSKTEAVTAKNKAEKLLLEVLESQKKNQELTIELSPRYYLEAKKHWDYYRMPQAMKNCDIALKLNPKNSEAMLLKGHLLYVEGRYKEADEYFKKVSGTHNIRQMIKRIKGSKDPVSIIIDKKNNSLKLREPQLRVLLKHFWQTGNMDYLKRVILIENPKITKLDISFKNGVLNLANNPGLENINFLGGMTFESLNLSKTSVDNLEAVSDKKINTLNLSDTLVWELFSLEGAQIKKLILGKTRVSTLWALMKVDVEELSVIQDKQTKFPVILLYRLKKLTMVNPQSVFFPPVKKPSLEYMDLSRTNIANPKELLNFTKLKYLKVNTKKFPKDILGKLKKRGVKIL